ncbi:hypothetical protein B0H11DRAFT_1669801, partial [Mycena galericulata]
PASAPSWFSDAVGELLRAEIGPRYVEVLKAFVELEEAYMFENGKGKLPVIERPIQVTDWIKGGRGRKKGVPAIRDIKAFETKWWSWWTEMQPAWRGRANGKPLRGEGGAEEGWGALVAPGVNGLLSVVATLYWWGYAENAGEEGNCSPGWEEAAADVIWV